MSSTFSFDHQTTVYWAVTVNIHGTHTDMMLSRSKFELNSLIPSRYNTVLFYISSNFGNHKNSKHRQLF